MLRIHTWRSVVCTVLLLSVPVVSAQSADLDYAVVSPYGVRNEAGYAHRRVLVAWPRRPEWVTAEPDYTSAQPMYLTVALGPAGQCPVAMALDSSVGPDGERDLLYVDRDRNGDLREETPVQARTYRSDLLFPATPVLINWGSHRVVYHLSVSQYSGLRNRYYVRSSCHHVGTLSLNGTDHRIALVDNTGNGRCDDAATLPYKGDRLLVDLNGDGEWKGSQEYQSVGRFNLIGGQFYSVRPEPDGASVTVTEADTAYGWIRFSNPVASIWLCSDNGLFRFEAAKEKVEAEKEEVEAEKEEVEAEKEKIDRVRVPVGSYRISGVTLAEREDVDGNAWRLGAGTKEEKMVPCVVREGETSIMPLGPPLRIDVTATRGSGNQINLGAKVIGQAGEEYGTFRRNDKEAPKPSLKIIDRDGKVLGEPTLDYG